MKKKRKIKSQDINKRKKDRNRPAEVTTMHTNINEQLKNIYYKHYQNYSWLLCKSSMK